MADVLVKLNEKAEAEPVVYEDLNYLEQFELEYESDDWASEGRRDNLKYMLYVIALSCCYFCCGVCCHVTEIRSGGPAPGKVIFACCFSQILFVLFCIRGYSMYFFGADIIQCIENFKAIGADV